MYSTSKVTQFLSAVILLSTFDMVDVISSFLILFSTGS